jgi:hypothetical protein
MADLFDTDRVRDDPEHWDALAARVAAAATHRSAGGAISWLAERRTSWVVASLAFAAVLLSMWASAETAAPAAWTQVLAPSDDVGKIMTFRDSPPVIGELLLDRLARSGR